MIEEATTHHTSERANAVLANLSPGARLHELALPRSERNPMVTARAEAVAQMAAAKLCQRHGRRILDVWAEDGMHSEFGMYRIFYIVTVPSARH